MMAALSLVNNIFICHIKEGNTKALCVSYFRSKEWRIRTLQSVDEREKTKGRYIGWDKKH